MKVKTEKENYIYGDVIKAEVQANYYFGAPVQEASVKYYVYRSQYWVPWWYWYDNEYTTPEQYYNETYGNTNE